MSFAKMEPFFIIQKLWGYEKILVNTPEYCGKILTVLPNWTACSVHFHKQKKETFTMLRGSLAVEIYAFLDHGIAQRDLFVDDDMKYLKLEEIGMLEPGKPGITLLPYQPHRFWACGGEVAEFIETSTTDLPEDSFRITAAARRDRSGRPTFSQDSCSNWPKI